MFEQELYNPEPTELRTQPGDPFHNYEIKNWNFSPRLYKILAASAVLNVVALLVVGTSGLLTARGCDSPFVGRVCQVLDTVYVGSLIFGTETDYADVDYDKTELGPDDEVTFVDVTGVTPPLSYPEGYFQLANPEQQFANVTDPLAATPGYYAPGIPMSNPTIGGSGLINTPAITPKSNPNAIDGDLPPGSPLGGAEDKPTVAGNRKGRRGGAPLGGTVADANTNTKQPDPNANSANPATAEPVDEAQLGEFGVYINKRPIKDKAKDSLQKIDAGQVKIDTPFRVTISGTLGMAKDGKTVVLKNPKLVPNSPPTKNDPAMEKFVQEWILAVGDAGWFGYLEKLDDKTKLQSRKLLITIEQNETGILASIRSEVATENEARKLASGLGVILDWAAGNSKGDEQAFLKMAEEPKYEGNNLVVTFKIPKPVAQEMIMRKLDESKKETKPEGNALVKSNDNTAKK